jgi:hypothetical protein
VRPHYLNAVVKEIQLMVKTSTNVDFFKQLQAVLICYVAASVSQEKAGGTSRLDLESSMENRMQILVKNFRDDFVDWVATVAHIDEGDTHFPEYLRHPSSYSVLLRKSLGG